MNKGSLVLCSHGGSLQGHAGAGPLAGKGLRVQVLGTWLSPPEGLWLSVSEVACVLFVNATLPNSFLLTSAQSPLQIEEKMRFCLLRLLGISHQLAQGFSSSLSS